MVGWFPCLPERVLAATSVSKRLQRKPCFLVLPLCNSLANVLDCLELVEIIYRLYASYCSEAVEIEDRR